MGIGYDAFRDALAFPMRDPTGVIVGIRRRARNDLGRKYAGDGDSAGLFIPAGVTAADALLVCEGETDTAAAFTIGAHAIGVPGARLAVKETAEFFRPAVVGCPCIIADNDAEGIAGADARAEAMTKAGLPCRVLRVPDPHGDLREWVVDGGLEAKSLHTAIGQCEVLYPDNWPPGFVKLPNALPRVGLIRDVGVGPWALFTLLASFWRGPGHAVHPTTETLADLLGVNPGTVNRWKAVLKDAGLLSWRRGGALKHRANEYRLNWGPKRWTLPGRAEQ